MGFVNNNLNSTTLIRSIYRSLLNTGRTYAAFEPRHMDLLENLRDCKEILDPMAGYGGLMKYCSESEYSLMSYNIEYNPPSYYWQFLMHPEHNEMFQELCKSVLKNSKRWPKPRVSIAVSDEWFPQESLNLLESLWLLILGFAYKLNKQHVNDVAIAILLPFVGRLSSCIQGNVVTHVKKGGLCVYVDWRKDFKSYLDKVNSILSENKEKCLSKKHTICFGDATRIKLGNKIFSAMFTSPPYPNTRDYAKMFSPENTFLKWLLEKEYVSRIVHADRLIGSSDVSEKDRFQKRRPDEIQSKKAREFLSFIENFSETKRAKKDNEVYYLPYYCNYFFGLKKHMEISLTIWEKILKGILSLSIIPLEKKSYLFRNSFKKHGKDWVFKLK